MHKTKSSKTDLSTYSNSPALNSFSQLAHRPYGSEIQKASVAAKTPTGIENEAFAEQQMEATGLEIQAKYDTITPEGQERLTVLQAKMDGLLNSRLSHATRFGHNIANIPLRRPHISTPIQAKLTIGEPGDKYEQEADETARQVVQRIHQPQSEKLQRESLPEEEEELQMKPERSIQQESLPAEEEELQMKPMVQRVADGGMAASPDLETSILQARGGGQSLADNIRQPMEQAFGTDFSGVKVHTGTQADQLNQSIHAKAFTTGQDVFFRQGAYEPGSQEGQKLLAHELTHVVQQGEGRAQGKQLPSDTPHSAEIEMQRQPYGKTEQREKISEENKEIQRNASVQMENKTGLPDNLKVGIENLSGLAMDDVRVHYNSPKPAELNALAYTQGSDIHVASGQEQHLPHEAWHVVQQTQGRVKPTMQMKDGVGANHEEGMEKEADVMGAKALQSLKNPYQKLGLKEVFPQSSPTVQAFGWEEIWSMAEGFGLSSVMVYTAVAVVGLSALYLLLKNSKSKEEALLKVQKATGEAHEETYKKERNVIEKGEKFQEPANLDELRAYINKQQFPPYATTNGEKRNWAFITAKKYTRDEKKIQKFVQLVRNVTEQQMLTSEPNESYSAPRSVEPIPIGVNAGRSKIKTRGVSANPPANAVQQPMQILPPPGYTLQNDSTGTTAYINNPNNHQFGGVALDHIVSVANNGNSTRLHRSTKMKGTNIRTYVHPSDHELYTVTRDGQHTDGIGMITVYEIGEVRGGEHRFR